MKIPYVKKPCKDCPFKTDTMQGWLGKERMIEILNSDSFVCHKTTKGNDARRKQCAGHMLMKGDDNAFVKAIKAHDLPLELSGKELVFKSETDCIEHHTY